ncbi:hypothetical protein CDAR_1121 [Caerostris darwini]|uniref:Uncharacterized protein n=1 Tax=Caerostris darwini TaxID=1538125 RepID=A0AAV4SS28_9ARAC|nr:hypothetical protein CDAR_931 [Caerostris darwini]GIY35307.1 hypothetical protein CDAR_1121 [Caerostris darwini]
MVYRVGAYKKQRCRFVSRYFLPSKHALDQGEMPKQFHCRSSHPVTNDKHPSRSCHFHSKYSRNEVGSGRENRTFHVHPVSSLEEHQLRYISDNSALTRIQT